MIIFVQAYIILCISLAIVLLIKPIFFKKYISFISEGKRYYLQGTLKLIFGTMLIMVASQTQLFWLFAIFGLWGFLEGIVLFVKPNIFKSTSELWLNRPDTTIRCFFGGGVLVCVLALLATL
jgi:uncharacterized protein YjeT (DUF2065 family)